ncbi:MULTISPECIES: YeiH family protein [Musicola]|uniref:Uncharacterized protein n=1 Tax=Musicola paradisiaca (strain Ech703) TaxID=579405 RepID=C6C8E3_MUSP7|nr:MULTISPECIES: YeiH family protein [Musicola]ACS86109.1 conserved hypothetical protein [Musicola paradisiaca Ech703]
MLPFSPNILQLQSYYRLRHTLTGMLLVGVLTKIILSLCVLPAVAGMRLGSLTLAILVGMAVGNTLYPQLHRYCDEGVQWSKHHLLRWGIILYGFRLSLQQIAAVGVVGILIDVIMLSSTFLLACWLGQRLFRLDQQTSMLIGAGSSICGAAAVLATAPVVKGSADKVAMAVATVVLFGTTSMFLYPWFYQHLIQYSGALFTAPEFGVYIGSTVHEVAQVVAAGHAIAPDTENMAVIGKMLRVMMLAPFLFLLSLWLKRRQPAISTDNTSMAASFPWFALGFVLTSCLNSLNLLPARWIDELLLLDNILLTMAMVALGIATRFTLLRAAGLRPILLALVLFIWLVLGGGAINLAVQHLFS